MINVKELRLGNYIIDDEGLLAKVIGFAPNDDEVRCDVEGGCWIIINAYEADGELRCEVQSPSVGCRPIPLTPEWLEKCGFVKDRNGWYLPGTQLSLTDHLYPCWLDRMLWPQDLPEFKEQTLKYLHQLQNLYFALTGQELTIKL